MNRLVSLLSLFLLFSLAFTDPGTHVVWNCGQPDGLVVRETSRLIALDEIFEQIGDEVVDENGYSHIAVFDGTIWEIDNNGLYVCDRREPDGEN